MKYRRMGRTGLRVSEICLGTTTFGFLTYEPEASRLLAGEHRRPHLPARLSAAAYPHAMLA